MNHEFFMPQSPKAERELSDDEIFEKIFSSKIDRVEKMEEDYKNNIVLVKSIEDKFIKITKESKEKNKRRIIKEYRKREYKKRIK